MKITPFQHSQILGYAVIGYGIFQAYAISNLLLASGLGTSHGVDQLFLPTVVAGFAVWVISLIAGISIQQRRSDPRILGLLFVFCAFGSFPLGTILSGYVLLYLFVFWENEQNEQNESQ